MVYKNVIPRFTLVHKHKSSGSN